MTGWSRCCSRRICPSAQGIQHQKFSIMDRQRLKNWQRQFHEQINTVRQIILPGEP